MIEYVHVSTEETFLQDFVASELLQNLEEMFSRYYMNSGLKSLTKHCSVTRREGVRSQELAIPIINIILID